VHWQVSLTEVEYVGPSGEGDIRTVVDREQLAVPLAGIGEHLERSKLISRLEALLTQLNDVDSTSQCSVEELL
jgi:hypothetical protein